MYLLICQSIGHSCSIYLHSKLCSGQVAAWAPKCQLSVNVSVLFVDKRVLIFWHYVLASSNCVICKIEISPIVWPYVCRTLHVRKKPNAMGPSYVNFNPAKTQTHIHISKFSVNCEDLPLDA